jgi:hypothetical protein
MKNNKTKKLNPLLAAREVVVLEIPYLINRNGIGKPHQLNDSDRVANINTNGVKNLRSFDFCSDHLTKYDGLDIQYIGVGTIHSINGEIFPDNGQVLHFWIKTKGRVSIVE